jgi:hypothetical protein
MAPTADVSIQMRCAGTNCNHITTCNHIVTTCTCNHIVTSLRFE